MTGPSPSGAAESPLIFLVSGEASGDAIGGRLMAALSRQTGGKVRFTGIGGESMTGQGLKSLFPMTDLSVMGVFEVLPSLRRILRRMRETAAAIEAARPAAVVSIDAPAFCFGVWRRLRRNQAPLIHYVAPTVWAWRPGRAAKYARTIDHLLALLPFEPPYFEREGLPCTFVGHPVLESGAADADGAEFRARHDIAPRDIVLSVLAGSRRGELARLLPIFGEAVASLTEEFPGLVVVLPAAPGVAELLAAGTASWPVRRIIAEKEADRYAAMAAGNAALAASGTVALELALAGVPTVVGYRINPLTHFLVRRMIRVRFGHLVNLLLDRLAVPEFMQDDCRSDNLAAAVAKLLEDPAARDTQLAAAREALAMLRAGEENPSDRAAGVIMGLIGAHDAGTEAVRRTG